MGIAERRERDKARRRAEIVEAAERVFFSRGWDAATMDDVAEEAELAKATLYLYFKSKESLYMAILARASHVLMALFEEAAEVGGAGIDRVRAIGRAYVRFFEEHRDYFDAFVYFGSRGPLKSGDASEDECRENEVRIMDLVARAVQEGIDDGSIRPDAHPYETAIILWTQTTGLLQLATVQRDAIRELYGVETERLLESYFAFVAHALSPAKGA